MFTTEDKRSIVKQTLQDILHLDLNLLQEETDEQLNTALKSLQEKLKHNEKMKGQFDKTVKHIK
ncbi:hypothetical protein QQF64_026302, partial [Cirrhinus molitorella]